MNHVRHSHMRPAQTIVETLGLIICFHFLVILGTLLTPTVLFPRKARACSSLTMEQSLIRQVQQAWVVFAHEDPAGRYPIPSMIHTFGNPNREQDRTLDTTANLYSALVAQNYFGTDVLVSPRDPNPNVHVDTDYDYNSYNPIGDHATAWDPSFVADLETGSNVSFAHTPLVDHWINLRWQNDAASDIVNISSRGVRDGAPPGTAPFRDSRTPSWHPPQNRWVGNLCFNDNHTEFVRSACPAGLEAEAFGVAIPDNIFRRQTDLLGISGPADAWLTFTRAITRTDSGTFDATTQFD